MVFLDQRTMGSGVYGALGLRGIKLALCNDGWPSSGISLFLFIFENHDKSRRISF